MANTPAIKRGWHWTGTALSSYVNGLEAIRLTPSSTGCDFMILGDTPGTYYLNWDASGPRLQIPSGVELDVESGATFTGAGTNTLSGTNNITNDVTMTAGKFISGSPIKSTQTTKAASATLTTAEAGLIIVTADATTMTLPTYVGNAGLRYKIMVYGTHSSGVYVYSDGEAINGAAGYTSTAKWDILEIEAAPASSNYDWLMVGKIGSWDAS